MVVWRRPPLRIESKGLVKYKYHTISKGIQLDSVRMLVTSDNLNKSIVLPRR